MKQPITYTAYRIAVMIIENEDFELEIGKDENGDNVFKLVDDNSANWGDIESDEFYNLATVIDRLEAYHDDYYFKEFKEKRNPDILSGKIPPDLSDGKPFEKYSDLAAICWFITNSAEILSKITPDVAVAFDYDVTLISKDTKCTYDRDTNEECLHYYVRQMLFISLFETLSAYSVSEYGEFICCSAYGDATITQTWKRNNAMGDGYRDMLEREKKQIIDDLKDLGKEGHYFDEYAFAYLGLLDEYDKN